MGGHSREQEEYVATDQCGWKTNAEEDITNKVGNNDVTNNGSLEGLDLVN